MFSSSLIGFVSFMLQAGEIPWADRQLMMRGD